MICILSDSNSEVTTENVMAWLSRWGIPCIRINGDDIDRPRGLTVRLNRTGGYECQIRNQVFDPATVSVVWYRKWRHAHLTDVEALCRRIECSGPRDVTALAQHLHREVRSVSEFFFSLFDNAVWLGNPWLATPNKLQVLRHAAACGLDIPETLVTTDVKEIRLFATKHSAIVSKPASDAVLLERFGHCVMSFTHELERNRPIEEWAGGFPSLFQESLEKLYELRIFYLDGKMFTCAIYNQNNPALRVDSRKFDANNPARVLPYQLPEKVESSLSKLMDVLHLDTGSIDLVRIKNGGYVFLEVNPVGQFEQHSLFGNFSLDLEVAKALVKRKEVHEKRRTTE
jgi:hypothetical protein